MARCIVSKEMDKITVCKAFRLPSAHINLDMLEAFSFADIDIVHQKTFFFFRSLIQVAAGIIKTSVIFNSNSEADASSFSYVAKRGCQAPPVGENKANKASDNKIISPKGRLTEQKTEDGHIEQEVDTSSGS